MNTVLLLEDDDITRALYGRVLGRTYRVLTALSPREAVSIADAESVDLFIADNILGVPRSGAETLHQVHERHSRLLLLLVSGTPPEGFSSADFDCFTELVQGGACEFLLKPFTTATFSSKVRTLLENGPDVGRMEKLLASAIAFRRGVGIR